jgi:hypothetical protein
MNPEFIIWYNQASIFEISILAVITIVFTSTILLFISGIITGLLSENDNQSNSNESDGIF